MFVLTPHPCVLVCVRVCVCVPAAWIVWIASDTTLAGSRPRKEVDFVVSSPSREYRNTTASTRDETLVCFCLSCTNKQTVKQKDPFFLFFLLFFLYRSRPIPVSCVQLCTGTCTNLYSLRFTRTRDFAEVKRYLVLSCAQSAQLVARHSLASPVNTVTQLDNTVYNRRLKPYLFFLRK